MLEPDWTAWVLIGWGVITFGPLLYAQAVMLRRPDSERAKTLMIGKGEDWRDRSHFKSALALARTDWLMLTPILVTGVVGILLGRPWGYVLIAAAGAISIYINIFLWFFEREYVYPAVGPLAYYTYIWGNFVYWGAAAVTYSIVRLLAVI